jgi:hypothetical protein
VIRLITLIEDKERATGVLVFEKKKIIIKINSEIIGEKFKVKSYVVCWWCN